MLLTSLLLQCCLNLLQNICLILALSRIDAKLVCHLSKSFLADPFKGSQTGLPECFCVLSRFLRSIRFCGSLLSLGFLNRFGLASDLGNVGAAVQEGIDGLHFAPGNAAALADAVRKLQNVGETFDLTAMQQKACQAYNAEQNYRELMTIYREIMRNENS